MKTAKQKLLQYCGFLGILGVVFYFLHVFVGGLLYECYNPVTQAISDLTAGSAPSRAVAGVFTTLYGVCTVAFLLAFFCFFRKKINGIFSLGALFMLIMTGVSAIGFTAFPLSGAGYANTFQDTMHIVTTVIVVVLSIVGLLLLCIGFLRAKKYKLLSAASAATLFLMMAGSVLLGTVPSILGIGERISIFSLQFYTALLAVWLIKYKDNAV